MKIKILFFLCTIVFVNYASDRSSFPVSFLDMCTVENQRMENQDRRSFGRLPTGIVIGVLDGHVTSEVADYVAYTFPGRFNRYLSNSSSEKEAFNKTFSDAENYALNNLKGGSTALFAYIDKKRTAHIAYVGDSRAAIGNKYHVTCATQDHTPGQKDELNRIIQAKGTVYREITELGEPMGPWRLYGLGLSRVIGDAWHKGKKCTDQLLQLQGRTIGTNGTAKKLLLEQWPNNIVEQLVLKPAVGQVIAEPEYIRLQLTDADHWLIIGSDGLWDVVGNEEALAIVDEHYETHNSLEGVAALLCDCAMERGSTDNITVLVVDLLQYAGSGK